jgi:hypothetical protein
VSDFAAIFTTLHFWNNKAALSGYLPLFDLAAKNVVRHIFIRLPVFFSSY